jgi:hypothetical protein
MALGNSVGDALNIVSATVQTVVVPGKGDHTIQVTVQLHGAGAVWIDDVSLTLFSPK